MCPLTTIASGGGSRFAPRPRANLHCELGNLCRMRTKWLIARIPDDIWAPFWEGALILIVGATAFASGHPWMFASLGPTAYEQAEKSDQKSARLYNVIVGHFVGLGSGFAGMAIVGAWNAITVTANTSLPFDRMTASVIAATLTTFVNLILDSGQPAALSTALLVTLGAYDTPMGALWLAVGVVILGAIGEPVRRMRLLARQKRQFRAAQKESLT
jgi:CBS domain-containing membrane protein